MDPDGAPDASGASAARSVAIIEEGQVRAEDEAADWQPSKSRGREGGDRIRQRSWQLSDSPVSRSLAAEARARPPLVDHDPGHRSLDEPLLRLRF